MKILSPAGSLEILKRAVLSGADEVYFGGQQFNARKSAKNLSSEEIAEAVRFCRLHEVKTLLTVNTMIFPSEWEGLCAYLDEVLALGVDAAIVQDLGVAAYIAAHFPKVELHASTQMSVASAAGVKQLMELGFSRVVLARELSLKEIREIYEETGCQLEVFVHGALCYCYSGQCFLSSFHGGKDGELRSANRGQCAMPCRLPYTIDGQTAHFFNLKDREGSAFLKELEEAGVYSLKIEGRLKSESYVAGVTRYYKERLMDEKPYSISFSEVAQLYNRGGFTKGYFHDKDDMVDPRHPKHYGVPVGVVKAQKGPFLTVDASLPLAAGDVLELEAQDGSIKEVRLSESMLGRGGKEAAFKLEGSFRKGAPVRRLISPALLDRLRDLPPYEPKAAEDRRLRMKAVLCEKEPLRLEAVFRGQTFEVTGPEPERAKTSALTKENVIRQLLKLGDTPFLASEGDLSINLQEGVFLPNSALNQARRELVQQILSQTLLKEKELDEEILSRRERFWKRAEETVFQSVSESYALGESAPSGSARTLTLEEAEKTPSFTGPVLLPPVWNQAREKEIERKIRALISRGCGPFLVESYAGAYLVRQLGARVIVTEALGVCNLLGAKALRSIADGITYSIELPPKEADRLYEEGARGWELAFGKIRYMVSPQCPYKERYGCRKDPKGYHLIITDRTGEAMECFCHCSGCYMELFSQKPLKKAPHPENGALRRK